MEFSLVMKQFKLFYNLHFKTDRCSTVNENKYMKCYNNIFYDFVQGNVILNFSPSCNVSGICLPNVSGNKRANNPLTKAPCYELMRKFSFFNKDW